MPAAKLELTGSSGSEQDNFSNQLIVWRLSLKGTPDITINYNGAFPIPGGGRSYLVE